MFLVTNMLVQEMQSKTNLMKNVFILFIVSIFLTNCADPNQSSIIKDMKNDAYEQSPGVQIKVSKYMNRDAIQAVPFFADCTEELLEELLSRLHTTYATSGDMIIQVNSIGTDMYILSKGEVNVISAEGKRLATLGEGSFLVKLHYYLNLEEQYQLSH